MINKKKLSLLLFTIISLLMFKTNVYAAQELTCLYGKSSSVNYHVILTQSKNGTRKVYLNQNTKIKEYKIESNGWVENSGATSAIKLDKSLTLDSSSNLKTCPKGIIINVISTTDAGKKELFTFKEVKFTDSCSGAKCNALKEERKNTQTTPSVNGAGNDSEKNVKGKKCTDIQKEIADGSKAYWTNVDKATLYCLYCTEVKNKDVELFQAAVLEPEISTSKKREIVFTGYGSIANYFQENTPYADADQFKSGYCPGTAAITTLKDGIQFDKKTSSGSIYTKIASKGQNLKTGLDVEKYEQQITIKPLDNIKNCEKLFEGESGQKILDLLIMIRKVIQISVPLILIAMGIVDFAKAIIQTNEDEMKKAQNKFIRRLIIGVAFFLVPAILNLLLTIASKIWPEVIVANSTGSFFCGIL